MIENANLEVATVQSNANQCIYLLKDKTPRGHNQKYNWNSSTNAYTEILIAILISIFLESQDVLEIIKRKRHL